MSDETFKITIPDPPFTIKLGKKIAGNAAPKIKKIQYIVFVSVFLGA